MAVHSKPVYFIGNLAMMYPIRMSILNSAGSSVPVRMKMY